MPERPHLAFPVQLKGSQLLEVEQDSDREVSDCIAVILGWPQGTRQGYPDFGTPNELFESGGPDLAALREAVAASEPRALALRDTVLDAALRRGIANVRFGFDQAASEAE
jgi:hypothetical protein